MYIIPESSNNPHHVGREGYSTLFVYVCIYTKHSQKTKSASSLNEVLSAFRQDIKKMKRVCSAFMPIFMTYSCCLLTLSLVGQISTSNICITTELM